MNAARPFFLAWARTFLLFVLLAGLIGMHAVSGDHDLNDASSALASAPRSSAVGIPGVSQHASQSEAETTASTMGSHPSAAHIHSACWAVTPSVAIAGDCLGLAGPMGSPPVNHIAAIRRWTGPAIWHPPSPTALGISRT